MADEARNSFALLLETGQRLLDELESVLKSSGVRQRDELVKNQPAHESRHKSRKAAKSSSIRTNEARSNATTHSSKGQNTHKTALESVQAAETSPVGGGPAITESSQNQPSIVKEQMPHLSDADALRLSQRKRKTMSACSLGDSQAARYRSKSMVVVYYDGEIQQRFESVVRTIGICRNSMRKGKMSARINSLSHEEVSGSSEETLGEDIVTPINLKLYSSRLRTNRAVSSLDGTEAFDKADSFLDKAQALCERAAHQVLRDGDCATEIQNAKENIMSAIEIGKAELPILQSKAEQAAQRRKKEEAELQQRETEAGRRDENDVAWDEKNKPGSRRTSPPNVLEVDELEVDSSAEDSDPSLSILGMLRLGKGPLSTITRAPTGLRAP